MNRTNKSRFIRLDPYQEVVGPFTALEEQDGSLLAEIAGYTVILPIEMKEALAPHLGSRIAVLRTDVTSREYLVRVLPDVEDRAKTMRSRLGDKEEISSCSGVI